jgi:dephospho-CoA kinase
MPKMRKHRLVVGLTGGIGTGKSAVLQRLKHHGAAVVSSDELARRCFVPGHAAYRSILRVFGPSIRTRTGRLDRAALAGIVFSQPSKRHALERIIHPYVIKDLKRFAASHRGLVVMDIPLLFEARLEHLADIIVCVVATRQQQIQRVRERSGLAASEVRARMRAQWNLSRKTKRADIVIKNTGSLQMLNVQVKQVVERLLAALWAQSLGKKA